MGRLIQQLSRLRGIRLWCGLCGLGACSGGLLLSVRVIRHLFAVVAAFGPARLQAAGPGLAAGACAAGLLFTAGFAALVYGTGGLTAWHEAADRAAQSARSPEPGDISLLAAAPLEETDSSVPEIEATRPSLAGHPLREEQILIPCTACGRENSNMVPFCAGCGADLQDSAALEEPDRTVA